MTVATQPVFSVRHTGGAYPVYIGTGLLHALPSLAERHCPGRRLAVIADENVARAVRLPLDAPLLTFPPGETSKSRTEWARLTDALLREGMGRDSAVIALGGGVTGDLAGFVAATYHRGIPLIQVPTSLVAMLDSSIGGKTGVDTPAGKNLVGAFHQPAAVIIDPGTLTTLPPGQIRNGVAEAVKHALIADRAHFGWLEAHVGSITSGDLEVLAQLVRISTALKAAIVEQDERELGLRAVLNAGHTVGHAIEAVLDWQMPHGDAVAIGLVVEAGAAEALGVADSGTRESLRALLAAVGLPTTFPPGIDRSRLLEFMRRDKKNRTGRIHCALPARIGVMAGGVDVGWTTAVPEDLLVSSTRLD